ncbi:MAG: hypothetical protein GF315_06780 [candidate division Zixibacteria bacterium]|nr:hypothetical protein [candidate division Zixibacteria bacterium]
MRKLTVITALFLLMTAGLCYSGHIEVIYPKPDSRLPSVDSTFILGNTDPGSLLYINSQVAPVHPSGGFLGFVDVTDGDFIFILVSINEKDTTILEVPVTIGDHELTVSSDSLFINPISILPTGDRILPADGNIKIGFSGTPHCSAFFAISDSSEWLPLYEDNPGPQHSGSVFGDISIGEQVKLSEYRAYVKTGTIADTIAGAIRYNLMSPDGDSLLASSAGNLSILDDEIRIVEFTGQSEIVRTAPGAGYLLLYQPPGIRGIYDGYDNGFIRMKLSNSLTAFVPEDSALVLPQGTSLPVSRLRYISIEDYGNFTTVNIPLSFKHPYRIEQELEPSRLIVYLYGVIADTDWIKYVPNDGAVRIAGWSQPEDDVYRLALELKDNYQWGYHAGYENYDFVLNIKKKPEYGGFLKSPVHNLRIAIDPGHCKDLGAVGPTGLTEMEVNLWIAHKLRKLLEGKGAHVIQTRYGYEDVIIYDRPQKAIDFNADLLISIHNNALPDGVNPWENNGVSTFYYHAQSKPLAEAIQKRLMQKTGLPDYGVYYGNLALTRPSEMISVLVECAFIMIPEQEAMLRDWDFQERCAEGIYDGICDFLEQAKNP